MPELPHGWRMHNSAGVVEGPPIEDDGFFSGSEDEHDLAEPLDIRPDSEGWEDAEEDVETVAIKCFLCTEDFPEAKTMVEHCKTAHDFDFLAIQKQHKLDFYSTIKLVNYIRSEAQSGKEKPDTSDPALWTDDKYMQPALDDDALLFSLDDIIDVPEEPVDEPQAKEGAE